MIEIAIKDIEKLAELSRIRLTDEETSQMRKDISSILGYVEQVQRVGEDAKRGDEEVRNVLRIDEKPHESALYTEDILANAPKREGRYVKVKKIL